MGDHSLLLYYNYYYCIIMAAIIGRLKKNDYFWPLGGGAVFNKINKL